VIKYRPSLNFDLQTINFEFFKTACGLHHFMPWRILQQKYFLTKFGPMHTF